MKPNCEISLTKVFRLSLLLLLTVSSTCLSGQSHQRPQNQGEKQMPTGRFYGKVVDGEGSGLAYATVRLVKTTTNSATEEVTEKLITGQITDGKGDFSLIDVPALGEYSLIISFIGFAENSRPISFGGNKPKGKKGAGKGDGSARPGSGSGRGFSGMNLDKDLGNIALMLESATLDEVTVTAEKVAFLLAIDKKEYRVDQDATSAGGDAVDALRNIPSISVDLDGNVSLRNGSPQIFVDGRPTTLTLDQISADIIETVEIITNPSAKYDAGGGTAGIINIVLKKDRRLGYNGNARIGGDVNGGIRAGANINARGEKINLFVSSFVSKRRGPSTGETYQQNFFGNPLTNFTQLNSGHRDGVYGNIRAGLDWFMDNRNTLTFSTSYTNGQFDSNSTLVTNTDSLFNNGTTTSEYTRISDQDRSFRNIGGAILFKHIFPKEGAEWTADINIRQVKFEGLNNYSTTNEFGSETLELQENIGEGRFVTFQTDFINPLSENVILGGGLRAAFRKNDSDNGNSTYNNNTQDWEEINRPTDIFGYTDNVYAIYGTLSQTIGTWGYQAGLRAESSFYTGTVKETATSFDIDYPFSLFPSIFITKKINELDNIQLSYTRRINRPNFFHTLPYTDISNPLNPRRGNTQLRPEFTNSMEFSYQKIMGDNHNVLVAVYFKQANDLITNFLAEEYVPELGITTVVTTFENSNKSEAIGAELTIKNKFGKKIELTSNMNLYNSSVDASNVEQGLVIDRFSWFLKENLSVKLPAGLTIQLSGQYKSKASFTPTDGRQRGHGRGTSNSAQGYNVSNWYVDAALRKDFLNRKLIVTLNVNDIFASYTSGSYTESELFVQESFRYRDPQVLRINLSYRFGKTDVSLFKRKNNKRNSEGSDMM